MNTYLLLIKWWTRNEIIDRILGQIWHMGSYGNTCYLRWAVIIFIWKDSCSIDYLSFTTRYQINKKLLHQYEWIIEIMYNCIVFLLRNSNIHVAFNILCRLYNIFNAFNVHFYFYVLLLKKNAIIKSNNLFKGN